jgi:hypothetical protein
MGTMGKLGSTLLSKGVVSSGWYSILTGLALLVVGFALGSVKGDDPAAGPVGGASFLAGLWQLQRGVRLTFPRRPPATPDNLESGEGA